MYFLVLLLAPLVLLGLMGMGWVEDHLLPPAEPPPRPAPVPARDFPPPVEVAGHPEPLEAWPGSAPEPAPGVLPA